MENKTDNTTVRFLSKSKYLRGRQCIKNLYLDRHHNDLRDEIGEAQQAIFSMGHTVGAYAQQLFPGGVDACNGDFRNIKGAVQQTKVLIENGTEVIYEAAFEYRGNICYLDILVKKEGKWFAYEVKGSTSVKKYYYDDTSFQYYVITNSGLPLDDISIIHVNSKYVRKGDIDIRALFSITTVHKEVITRQQEVARNIEEFGKVMNSTAIPDIQIGEHCSDPYNCDFQGHCWKTVPAYSIFNISNLGWKKKMELYHRGILEIKDVPDDFPLSDKQRFQVIAEKTGKGIIDKKAIRFFMEQLQYPLFYLDFETHGSPVPLYDNASPYEQIPFQYSLHIQRAKGAEPEHREFLGTPPEDPRPELIRQLVSELENEGSIIVYNQGFEVNKLKKMAGIYPQYAPAIDKIINRIVDLIVPFRSKSIYLPAMKGSYSIKEVLPALVPKLSYKELDISEGGMASRGYDQLFEITDAEKTEKIRKDLLAYCRLDTLGMVEIIGEF